MKNHFSTIPLIALVSLSSCTEKKETQKHPNIIYILTDDLGYGDISVNNKDSKIKTPNIDRLASEGIRFTDAHTSSSVSTPTRYGILTGRYNWRSKLKSGVLSGKSKALIPTSRTTVASMLKQNGYATAFIGKWHLGWDWAMNNNTIDFSKAIENGPKELGFDYSYGHSGSLDMAPYVYVENGMPTEIPDSVTVNKGKYSWWRKGLTASDFIHDDVTPNFFRRSFDYIQKKSTQEKPFFLYLALPSPHTPILPTEEWQGKSNLNPYGDFVMMLDDYMGQLESVLEKAGIKNNTMVIFTSDNGCSPEADIEELQQMGHQPCYIYRGHKADIFEGGHRVPFIVRWPKEIKKESVSHQTICTTDLMATCASIVGYSLLDNEGEDSYDLLPLLKQPNSEKTVREATVHHSIDGSFAIRKGDWKLIMCPSSGGWSFPKPNNKEALDSLAKYQLYNLQSDPSESENLYGANLEKVEELKSLLIKYIIEGRSTAGAAQKNDSIDFKWKQIDFVAVEK